eukprot:scaffold17579_cov32-Attheya_sp.AAC.1
MISSLFVTPQSIVVLPGKNDRLAFDGSAKLKWDSLPVNCMTHTSDEPDLLYGTAWNQHLTQIWNLRISYPNEDILVFDDDVSVDMFQPQMGQIENSPPSTHHRRDLRKMSHNGLTNHLQGTQLE